MLIRIENANPVPHVQEFDSYDSAILAGSDTYDCDFLSAAVVENTNSIIQQRDFQNNSGDMEHLFLAVPIAARNATGPVRVLDFGGAAGLHAVLSIRNLTDVDQRWAIVETPSMVKACSGISSDTIQFFETAGEAKDWLGGVDLVHCSETLHFMPNPLACLKGLQAIGAPMLLVQKSALSLGRQVIELETLRFSHDFGGVTGPRSNTDIVMPMTYINQDDFVVELCDGYDIAFAFNGQPYKTINDIDIEFGSAYLLQKR